MDAIARKQRACDTPIVKDDINHLFTTASQQDKSKLLAVTSSHSIVIGCRPYLYILLHVVSAKKMQISVLLLAYILVPHSVKHISAPAKALVQVNGLHSLLCKLGSDKHSRQASFNDIIYRACCRADTPVVKEPTRLIRTDSKRPDGSTLAHGQRANVFFRTLRLPILWALWRLLTQQFRQFPLD